MDPKVLLDAIFAGSARPAAAAQQPPAGGGLGDLLRQLGQAAGGGSQPNPANPANPPSPPSPPVAAASATFWARSSPRPVSAVRRADSQGLAAA